MEVIILAGGLGTRLQSEVKDVPKCMAPINGKPFLWYLLKNLSKYQGLTRVILSVGYLRESVIDWIVQNKCSFPFVIDFAVEEQPLGTGGGIKLALSLAKSEDVVILNGDTFFDVNLCEIMKSHIISQASVTLALKPMINVERYGSVMIDRIDYHITGFREKEFCGSGLINGGVYVINKNKLIFDGLGDKFSFEKSVLEPLCKTGTLFGIIQNCYFIDIGIPEDYRKAIVEFRRLFA